jgi:hypothetical protein
LFVCDFCHVAVTKTSRLQEAYDKTLALSGHTQHDFVRPCH